VFVAGMGKAAANELGTDGDMASVGIIAHEMGHAVAMQLGYRSRSSYENESTADCLAGAFAKQSEHDGYLEKGDIEEAFYGMSLAGDPVPEPTGNPRYDAMVHARLARQSHGTKDQRMDNFRAGLNGGAKVCLSDFR
jgi:predicted metalloprotease